MMTVLPDSFHHHQRRIRRQSTEYFHSEFLAIDESMLLDGVEGIPATHLAAFLADGIHDGLFGLGLRRPALLVGREPQIPTRNHNYSVRHVRIVPCQAPGVHLAVFLAHNLAINHAGRAPPGTDETAMDFRRLLPEIRWQSRLSPVPLTGRPPIPP